MSLQKKFSNAGHCSLSSGGQPQIVPSQLLVFHNFHSGWLLLIKFFPSFPEIVMEDFGDYSEAFYSVLTSEGEKMSRLISSYVDLILETIPTIPSLMDDVNARDMMAAIMTYPQMLVCTFNTHHYINYKCFLFRPRMSKLAIFKVIRQELLQVNLLVDKLHLDSPDDLCQVNFASFLLHTRVI